MVTPGPHSPPGQAVHTACCGHSRCQPPSFPPPGAVTVSAFLLWAKVEHLLPKQQHIQEGEKVPADFFSFCAGSYPRGVSMPGKQEHLPVHGG